MEKGNKKEWEKELFAKRDQYANLVFNNKSVYSYRKITEKKNLKVT